MSAGARTAATLAGLLALVMVAALWGWSAATKPFPENETPPDCVDTQVAAGEQVFRDQVVVSVYNGSQRSRLAAETMALLTQRGFVAGDSGNAPERTAKTQILAPDPANPAVALVKAQFKGAEVVPANGLGPGVTVVVGEKFKALRKKKVESVVAEGDAVFCAAPGADSPQSG